MYRITAESTLGIKTYWCTSSELAQQLAGEIGARFNCECIVQHVPEKRSWASSADAAKNITLPGGYQLRCTNNEFCDAKAHEHDNVFKINAQEIFCFPAEDALWQNAK